MYKLIIDYGKPYEVNVKTQAEVFKELQELKAISESEYEDIPYMDIEILENEKDITDEFIVVWLKMKRKCENESQARELIFNLKSQVAKDNAILWKI